MSPMPLAKWRARRAFVNGLLETHAGKIREGDAKAIGTVFRRALKGTGDNRLARTIITHLLEESANVRFIGMSKEWGDRVEGDLGDNIRLMISHGPYLLAAEGTRILGGFPVMLVQTRHVQDGWKNEGTVLKSSISGELRNLLVMREGLIPIQKMIPVSKRTAELVDMHHQGLLSKLGLGPRRVIRPKRPEDN